MSKQNTSETTHQTQVIHKHQAANTTSNAKEIYTRLKRKQQNRRKNFNLGLRLIDKQVTHRKEEQ